MLERKFVKGFGAALAVTALCAGPVLAQSQEVIMQDPGGGYGEALRKVMYGPFEKETGIRVNVAHMTKGMVERLQAEGKRSPADLVFTVDIARLEAIVGAGLTQPVTSPALEANVRYLADALGPADAADVVTVTRRISVNVRFRAACGSLANGVSESSPCTSNVRPS